MTVKRLCDNWGWWGRWWTIKMSTIRNAILVNGRIQQHRRFSTLLSVLFFSPPLSRDRRDRRIVRWEATGWPCWAFHKRSKFIKLGSFRKVPKGKVKGRKNGTTWRSGDTFRGRIFALLELQTVCRSLKFCNDKSHMHFMAIAVIIYCWSRRTWTACTGGIAGWSIRRRRSPVPDLVQYCCVLAS